MTTLTGCPPTRWCWATCHWSLEIYWGVTLAGNTHTHSLRQTFIPNEHPGTFGLLEIIPSSTCWSVQMPACVCSSPFCPAPQRHPVKVCLLGVRLRLSVAFRQASGEISAALWNKASFTKEEINKGKNKSFSGVVGVLCVTPEPTWSPFTARPVWFQTAQWAGFRSGLDILLWWWADFQMLK